MSSVFYVINHISLCLQTLQSYLGTLLFISIIPFIYCVLCVYIMEVKVPPCGSYIMNSESQGWQQVIYVLSNVISLNLYFIKNNMVAYLQIISLFHWQLKSLISETRLDEIIISIYDRYVNIKVARIK